MADTTKVTSAHLQRVAVVYIRQSTPGQVEQHRESTARQYALADRARDLGWTAEQVQVIDEDLGVSGSVVNLAKRTGFAHLITEVALAHVGIVLGLEVSRLARSNADWYRLLDLCGVTDTLIGDGDGIYHPALFNDRLVLGLNRPRSYNTSCSTLCGSGRLFGINCIGQSRCVTGELTRRPHSRLHRRVSAKITPRATISVDSVSG